MIYNAPVRSFVRLLLYVGWIFTMIPVQAVALLLSARLAERIPLLVHRVVVWILDAKVTVKGEQVKEGAVLFVCNHASYADISLIGAHIRGSFVAKAEVAKWPLFGICAKLSRTVFVDRRARYARQQAEEMKRRFERGDRLILFPEGTSSDGNRVLPFRSSLFATAEIEIDGKPVAVQPVSLAYTRLDGIPMGRHLRPFFAWYGDMEMFSHLWGIVGVGRSTVVLEFHKPVTVRDFPSRKALAAYCQSVVAAGVSSAISGRPQSAPAPGAVPDGAAPAPGALPA
ncbi:MAG: 1-acyl-sn-glycerol-3-phosphate acyltransferase [Candidatus Odyssella sp.]|nr:1-acyl-sn-glycerol-3-phosphate acyltransferase [Candidatus Odyssella sp.]